MTEDRIIVRGGRPLSGHLFVQGSKNSILPMIAAALVVKKGQTVLRNVPPLKDITTAVEICNALGAQARYFPSEQIVTIDASKLNGYEIPPELSCKLRASVLFLAPLLTRIGRVHLPSVGGCCIGSRAIDFHHRGFVRLGARTLEVNDDGYAFVADRMKGSALYLDVPSHTGTENLLLAAALAEGVTVIENAATDPEVVDFSLYLRKMGARIKGLGTRTLIIKGVRHLHSVDYTTMPDRLDAGTFMAAVAATQGSVTLIGARLEHLRIVTAKLAQMGLQIVRDGSLVRIWCRKRLRPINVITCPYPGFPTDLQPVMMALAAIADGDSYLRENIFEDRFTQAEWLNSMGADISVKNARLAVVRGVEKLQGAVVSAQNIRAGAAMLIAALTAEGETAITEVEQLFRGYSGVVERFRKLSADIELRRGEEFEEGPANCNE